MCCLFGSCSVLGLGCLFFQVRVMCSVRVGLGLCVVLGLGLCVGLGLCAVLGLGFYRIGYLCFPTHIMVITTAL